MVTGVQHIIFDLGGVLLNIDYQLTENAFVAAGISNFRELYSQLQQTPLFDDLEMGRIGQKEFLDAMHKASPVAITDEQILTAWNAMLLDFPLRRLQILQQLRMHHDLFLLSNTNIIHEIAFNDILMNTRSIPSIATFFDRAYFSHRVGLRKPMKEIFQMVIDENGLKPSETLFIDDSPQHIEGAKQVGIQTIYLQKGMTIENDIFKAVR